MQCVSRRRNAAFTGPVAFIVSTLILSTPVRFALQLEERGNLARASVEVASGGSVAAPQSAYPGLNSSFSSIADKMRRLAFRTLSFAILGAGPCCTAFATAFRAAPDITSCTFRLTTHHGRASPLKGRLSAVCIPPSAGGGMGFLKRLFGGGKESGDPLELLDKSW